MKNLYRILIALLAFSFIAVSCKDKEYEYIPGEPDASGCYGVFFPTQDASGSHTYDPSMERQVAITVSRTNSSGAITVPFTVTTSEDGVFNFGTINFADGQSETELVVTFPNAKVGVDYSFSVQIEDKQYASFYNDNPIALDFSVLIVEWQYFLNPVTKEKAKFTFYEDWKGLQHTGYLRFYDVDGLRTCETETDPVTYESDGQMVTVYGFWGTNSSPEGARELKFRWYTKSQNSDGYDFLELPEQTVTHHATYDKDVKVYDYYYYWTVMNTEKFDSWLAFAQKYSDSYPLGYYNGNGDFNFYVTWYYMIGLGGWKVEDYTVKLLADGFIRVDYSIDIDVDYSSEGVLPVSFTSGKDVATIKFAGYEGDLTATQAQNKINDIIAGADEGVVSVKPADYSFDDEKAVYYGTVGLDFSKTGTYTIIALAYDEKGGFQGSTYASGPYVAAGDVEKNTVDIHVATEKTPERYIVAGLDHYSSFSFYVYGKGVTDAHVGVFKTKSVAANPSSYLTLVKTNLNGEEDAGLKLPEASIAQLNATGGFFDVVSGLTDGTSYTIIVWATNGVMDKFVTAEWTTEKVPEAFKTLGTGTWTDDLLAPLFSVEPPTFNVTVAESEETPGKYKVIYPYGAGYPLNKPGMYDDSESYDIIINASDPTYVYMPMQETGCNWGYGMMSICDNVGRYMASGYSVEVIKANGIAGGTLKDGVITFGTKSMFVFDDDGGYYGNENGAFKLVLPAAASSAPVKLSAPSRPSSFTKNGSSAPKLNKMAFERDPQPVKMKVVPVNAERHERRSVSSNTTVSRSGKSVLL